MPKADLYVKKVLTKIKQRDPNEPEFFQAVQEVLESLVPFLEKNPQYEANSILERITEPERVIFF
ncbi:MAG: NADP-specific glutamate dehydrogenase, partial [Fusobacteriaceae bacterium]